MLSVFTICYRMALLPILTKPLKAYEKIRAYSLLSLPRDLQKTYRTAHILTEIDIAIQPIDFLELVGPPAAPPFTEERCFLAAGEGSTPLGIRHRSDPDRIVWQDKACDPPIRRNRPASCRQLVAGWQPLG